MNKIAVTILLVISCFTGTIAWSQNINLKVVGDDVQGYTVDIYDGNQLLVKNTEEFSLRMANLDLSETASMAQWKGSKWTGNATTIRLTRDSFVSEFDLNVSIAVTYQVINNNVVRKSIDLTQSGMPSLYYTIEETAKPAQKPSKYVTFEHDNFPGGFAHEMFPAAGFVTPDNQVVGFLMDAGYKNHYTRTTRRRFNGHGGGFVGMRKLPDPALVSVATLEERKNNQNYVKQKFGELYNLDAGTEVKLKLDDKFTKVGEVQIEKQAGIIKLAYNSSSQSGIEMLVPLMDQKIYTISFLSKGTAPVAVKLFRIKNGKKTIELENGVKYIDKFPVKENE
ncbi:MAG TPA: hypothetical protein VLR29_01195, partial [Flavobacterium sp.]|nr:hypothetical protein [Flavobacterium sp.]